MGRVIVITSGKGGVGKTTASASIGAALARLGKSVVLVDTDIGLRNLDVVLGLETRIVFDLVDVVEGACELEQALVRHPKIENLTLLAAAQTRDKSAVSPEQMQKITSELEAAYDFVLIDCPAGIEEGFKNAVAGAGEAIVVTNPEMSAVRDADRVIGLLLAYDIVVPRLLVNKVRPDMVRRGDMMSLNDIIDVLSIDLIGVVPDDEQVIKAGNLGQSVTQMRSDAGEAYMNIARRITGEDVPFMEFDSGKKKKGFFSRIFGR